MPLNVTLASSLLDLELSQDQRAAQCGGRTWRTGNSCLDTALPADLWCGGTVVGIGVGGSGSGSGIESGTRSLSLSLAHEIIVTHLLDDADAAAQRGTGHIDTESDTGSGTSGSVFIIAPPDQATSSIRRIYQLLNERVSTSISQVPTQPQPRSSRTRSTQASPPPLTPDATAKHLLVHVSLLQYLDISGLSESLSEVLTVLTSPSATQTKSILLVQGLTGCVNATLRRSGMVQSAALLASVVGAIRDVVRGSGQTCIGFVEMELGWVNPDPSMRADGNTNMNPSHVAPRGTAAALRGTGLETAFASQTGRITRINLHATLARVVEDGVDVLVAVHDADGKMSARGDKRIAEVVRDERADHAGEASALGTWAVWE
ncbi:hypothetical protein LTR70_000338 [Exophiala xenobiotica]|uniref:Uncharacterized protein n=1 Tax=Lithohypha guttulata TaxID=1690604 RepID=A0ABR0KRH4_9EURO|nr:hypothetical protein LTR24_000041 [Lithohypha guttulata]KAK5330508.1 hypothetical protein LTR70_000338 [Exophiala xenobiotica]